MKLKNRYIRMASALTIVGLVASQIPSRSSISLAANHYGVDSSGNIITPPLALVLIGAAVTGLAGGGAVASGVGTGGAMVPGNQSIIQIMEGNESVSDFVKIWYNAGTILASAQVVASASDLGVAGVVAKAIGTKEAKEDGYTVFAPTNDSLARVLGAEKVELLKQPAQREMAKAFVLGQMLAGRYNINRLNATASSSKSVFALSGDSVSLKTSGGKLMANTAEVLSSEYPANNGWLLITNGVVNY